MSVDVIVIGPVIVAVHVHGNDTVIVILPVAGRGHETAANGRSTTPVMLSFQKLDVYQRSIEFLAFARQLLQRIPRGHADLVDQLRRAAQSIPQKHRGGKTTRPDVMRVEDLIDVEHHGRGVEFLERVVAMLTKMIDP